MVHIEKVEIYGFKSFGFKNTTVKLVPGLVSISGPNGSGKSNILDAITFALGEKSAKVMRTDKLKSLIHDVNGSRTGTRIARTSVHLDNSDRSMPVDSDRVEVTRVLNEDGESTYYLNKQKTTRGRIQDMLEVVNAGLSQLNNVQQGTITRISEFSSEEKRKAIEDLVGLSSFDERKEMAQRELEQADRRLEVALAKMGEVSGRISELEEERNHMIRRDILDRELSRYSTVRSLQNLTAERNRARSLEEESRQVGSDLEENRAQLKRIRDGIESMESQKSDRMAEAAARGDARKSMEMGIARALEDYQNAETDLKLAERRITQIDDRAAAIRTGILEIIESRRKNRLRADDLRQNLKDALGRRDSISRELAAVDGERTAILDQQARAAARAAESEERLKGLRAALAGHQRDIHKAEIYMDHNIRQAESDEARRSGLDISMKEITGIRNRLDAWINRQESSSDSIQADINRMASQKDKVASDLDTLNHLIETVGSAAARYDSKLRLVKKVMHEDYSIGRLKTEAPGLGVLGLAYELLSWPAKFERAVMAAGSDWLKALVVEDVEAMAAISEAARSLKLPRLRIIPLSQLPTAPPPEGGARDMLAARVSCDERLEPLKAFLFGGVALAGSSGEAGRMADEGLRAVTINGECVEPGRPVIIDRGSRISNLTKIISMSAEVGGLQKSMTTLEAMRSRRAARLRSLESRISSSIQSHADLRERLASATQSRADLESRLESARRAHAEASSRLDSHRARMPDIRLRYQHLVSSAEDAARDISAEEGRVPANLTGRIAAQLASVNQNKADLEAKQTQANSQYSKSKAEWDHITASGRDLIRRASNLAGEQASLIREKGAVSSKIPLHQKAVASGRLALETLRQQEQQVIETSDASLSLLKDCEARLTSLRAGERTVSGAAHSLQRRQDSLNRDLDDCRARAARIAESIPPRHPSDLPLEMDVAPLISQIEDEIKSLPPLNANAPASYASVSEGYRSMSERKNSLEQERNRIVSFIEDVEKDKRQVYLNAFDTVDTEIRAIFGKMSKGNAWLELEDEDDVFGSGITYMVQFPGKPKRISTAISGGEKTLAAIVFVLALQKLNPSPFYLFDEVDAHLDAPNSEILANILEERSQNSQFIMVSLKEFVVQKAGLVYGVYPKNGTSQTVAYHDRRARPVAT